MQKLIANWWLDNAFLIAIVYSLFIVSVSLVSTNSIKMETFHQADKLFHFAAYVLWMWVWLMVFQKRAIENKQFGLLILLTFFGIIIELTQGYLTSYRTADYRDVLANVTGLILGLIIFNIFIIRQIKKT